MGGYWCMAFNCYNGGAKIPGDTKNGYTTQLGLQR